MTELSAFSGRRPTEFDQPTIPGPRADGVTANEWLHVRCDTTRPGLAVCTVAGEIDAGTLHLLEHTLDQAAADDRVRAIVADLSEVTFFSVSGVQTLLSAASGAAAAGRELVAVVSTRAAQRVFELTGAERAFPWYATRADALEAAQAWIRFRAAVQPEPVPAGQGG